MSLGLAGMDARTRPGAGARPALRQGIAQPRPVHAVSRRSLSEKLLYFTTYLALFRGTGMWFAYPSAQDENALIDPRPLQMVLYSIIPLIGLYLLLEREDLLKTIRRTPAPVALFALLVLGATVFSVNLVASLRGLAAVLILTVPMLLFKARFGPVRTLEMLRNFCIAAVLVNLAYTAVLPRYSIMSGALAGAVRGMFVHKNFFGQFSALAFVLLLPVPAAGPHLTRRNLVLAGTALLAFGSVLLSRSSTAVVLSAVGLMSLGIYAMVSRLPGRPLRAYLIVVALIVTGTAGYTFGLALLADVAGSFGKDLTLSGRTDLWAALMHALGRRPWLGHGFAMFRQPDYIGQYTRAIAWHPRSTHNTYLEIALNLGIPAALVWVAILVRRLISRAISVPAEPRARVANGREVAVMLMVMAGAITEAGIMLAPQITWPILLAVLPGGPAVVVRRRHAVPAVAVPVPDRLPRRKTRMRPPRPALPGGGNHVLAALLAKTGQRGAEG